MNSEKKLFIAKVYEIIYYSYRQGNYEDFVMQLNNLGVLDEKTRVSVKTDDDFEFIGEISDSNLPTKKVMLINSFFDDVICFKLVEGQSDFLKRILNLDIFDSETKWIYINEDDDSIHWVDTEY